MFAVIMIVVLVVVIIVLLIRYMRINADVLSREEFQIAADRKADKLKREDPIITCDYCGSTIDTRIHTHCPNCGAPYGEDKQWNKRNEIDDEWVNDQAHISAEIQRKKAEVKSAPTAKGLRYSIVTLVCFLVFVASLITASLFFSYRSESRKDEDVNENSYDHYVRSNYHVIGDETIFEHDGLSIKITGFYEESRTSSFSPLKIEFTVENNTGEKQRVVMKTAGMNGISDHYYLFVYDTFDPGTTVFYEKAYNVPGNAISEIIFNRISMESKDYTKRYEVKDCIRVKTSAILDDIDIEPEGNLIYSSDLVDVYSKDSEDHRGYSLYVQNKSEHDFTIDSDNMMIDGKTIDYNVIYDMAVPAGYLFHEEHIRVHDESFDGYENKEVKISISFKCDKDPSLDFSTGYIELK